MDIILLLILFPLIIYVIGFVLVTIVSYSVLVHEYLTKGSSNNDKFKFGWWNSFQVSMIVGSLWPFLAKHIIVNTLFSKTK